MQLKKNKILKWLNSFEKIDVIGIIFFFLILFSSALFLLRRSEYVYITIRVTKEDSLHNQWWVQPSNWYLKNLTDGLEDKDLMGKVNARLENMYFYPRNESVQDIFIVLKLEATYNKRSNQYSYKGLPLLMGSYQKIELGGNSIRGMVQDLSLDPPVRKMKSFRVKVELEAENNRSAFTNANIEYRGIDNFLADPIKVGLVSYDSEKEEIVKVIDVKKSPSYKIFVSPLTNKLVSAYDPDRQKVEMEMIVKQAEVFDGTYLYREDLVIALGEVIPLYFDSLTLNATVTGIDDL